MAGEYQTVLENIKELIVAAAPLMAGDRQDLGVQEKNPHDYVTECDKAVQAFLMAGLAERYPDAAFVAEEEDAGENFDGKVAGKCFLIDPIDGTLNFMTGMPLCCISVAYAEGGVVRCGAVYNPFMGEMFEAVLGCGAKLNGTPIRAVRRDLDKAELLCEYGWRADFHKVKDNMMSFRVLGSAALAMCWLGAGRGGAYVASVIRSWDMAAAGLIAEESGLALIDLKGEPYGLRDSGTPVACHPDDVDGVLAAIEHCLW